MTTSVPQEALERTRRPKLLIAALYHPEYFPLPRFPLGISWWNADSSVPVRRRVGVTSILERFNKEIDSAEVLQVMEHQRAAELLRAGVQLREARRLPRQAASG